MKKCPYCTVDIHENATKCRYCGEFLTISDTMAQGIFVNYSKWLTQNYPAYNIVHKDEEERSVVLNKKYKSFNVIVFILLLFLGAIPGIIYAAVTLSNDKIITLTINFDDIGQATISNISFKFLADKYNNNTIK